MGIKDFFNPAKRFINKLFNRNNYLFDFRDIENYLRMCDTGRMTYERMFSELGLGDFSRRNAVRLSKELYGTNEFAQGLVDGVVNKIINNGLSLTPSPDFNALLNNGIEKPEVVKGLLNVKSVYDIWKADRAKVSYRQKWAMPELERIAYRESLILGDVLVVVIIGADGLPQVEIIGGDRVMSPSDSDKMTDSGVKLNEYGKETGYFVQSADGNFSYVPAWTEDGRRCAWLLKANDGSYSGTRGTPFLQIVMRTLHEINSSLAAEQRAMLINSLLVLVHNRAAEQNANDNLTERKIKLGLGRGRQMSSEPAGEIKTNYNQFNLEDNRKGLMLLNMSNGETVQSHDTKRPNVNVLNFIMDCVKTSVRAKGVPPEVYFMEYNNSYSASTNAKNDFFDIQRKEAERFSSWFNTLIFKEFLIGVTFSGLVDLPKYKEAVINKNWLLTGAWEKCRWNGCVEKIVDLKLEKVCESAVSMGWLTNSEICRRYYGSDFEWNIAILEIEQKNAAGVVKSTQQFSVEELAIIDGDDSATPASKTGFTEDGNKI